MGEIRYDNDDQFRFYLEYVDDLQKSIEVKLRLTPLDFAKYLSERTGPSIRWVATPGLARRLVSRDSDKIAKLNRSWAG